MIQHAMMTLGDPGTFTLTDKSNPLYYVARYAHECSLNLYHLSDANFTFEQTGAATTNTFNTNMATYLTSLASWMTSAVAASEAGTSIPALPTMPSFVTAPGTMNITNVYLRIIIQIALEWLKKKLDGDTDATEIAQVLKRALLKEDASGDEYALMEQLSNVPLEIVVSRIGEYEDHLYSDRPLS